MDLIIIWSSRTPPKVSVNSHRQDNTPVFSECQGSASGPILGTLSEGDLHSSAIGLQHDSCAPFEK